MINNHWTKASSQHRELLLIFNLILTPCISCVWTRIIIITLNYIEKMAPCGIWKALVSHNLLESFRLISESKITLPCSLKVDFQNSSTGCIMKRLLKLIYIFNMFIKRLYSDSRILIASALSVEEFRVLLKWQVTKVVSSEDKCYFITFWSSQQQILGKQHFVQNHFVQY